MKQNIHKSFKDLFNLNNGEIIKNSHFYCIRVFYEDTDAGGIVYHANYLKFFERARTSLLNCLNIDQYELFTKDKVRFVVREVFLKITGTFELNDLILIETRHKYAKKTCIYLEQLAWNLNKDFNKDILKVKSEAQIVMINDESKVKNIQKTLSHPFFESGNFI